MGIITPISNIFVIDIWTNGCKRASTVPDTEYLKKNNASTFVFFDRWVARTLHVIQKKALPNNLCGP